MVAVKVSYGISNLFVCFSVYLAVWVGCISSLLIMCNVKIMKWVTLRPQLKAARRQEAIYSFLLMVLTQIFPNDHNDLCHIILPTKPYISLPSYHIAIPTIMTIYHPPLPPSAHPTTPYSYLSVRTQTGAVNEKSNCTLLCSHI